MNSGLGDHINITSYTSTEYTFPSDGYAYMSCPSSTSSSIAVRIYGSNGKYLYLAFNGTYQYDMVFVKKGMKAKVVSQSNEGQLLFYPII